MKTLHLISGLQYKLQHQNSNCKYFYKSAHREWNLPCKLCDPIDFKAARCSKIETGKQCGKYILLGYLKSKSSQRICAVSQLFALGRAFLNCNFLFYPIHSIIKLENSFRDYLIQLLHFIGGPIQTQSFVTELESEPRQNPGLSTSSQASYLPK